jgi:nicotinamide-nucleotide amidase
MIAFVLAIGDELVLGQTIDSNSAWLSAQLAALGCEVIAHQTVGDDQAAIERAIRDAAPRCDFLLISGGLGPTPDDLTRYALAVVLDQPLQSNPAWLDELTNFFQKRGRPMPESNKVQALIPRGAKMIRNSAGTAAGIDAVLHTAPQRSCRIFAVPGVPMEMKLMFQRDLAPQIVAGASAARPRFIRSATLHTFGLGESAVAQKLGDLMDRTANPSVGTTVSAGIVSLRINARSHDPAEADQQLRQTADRCRAALGELIFGQEEQTLASVVGELLTRSGQTVTTAESCTGGLLAKMLTDVSGSSRYFQRGWIVYSDQAKVQMLGVAQEVLDRHGAVSEPVVAAMAAGALERSGASFALSISGIAGPDGGTDEKPVGTVCIALAQPDGVTPRTFHFPGDREMIRDRSAKMALALLRFKLLAIPPLF